MPLLDTRTTTGTVRYTAKCAVKGCRAITSALVEVTTTTDTYGLPTGGGHNAVRRHRYEVVEGGWTAGTLLHGKALIPVDPCGHGRMVAKPVHGRLSDGVKCDRRCTGARGHDCECSCAGSNHGADHA